MKEKRKMPEVEEVAYELGMAYTEGLSIYAYAYIYTNERARTRARTHAHTHTHRETHTQTHIIIRIIHTRTCSKDYTHMNTETYTCHIHTATSSSIPSDTDADNPSLTYRYTRTHPPHGSSTHATDGHTPHTYSLVKATCSSEYTNTHTQTHTHIHTPYTHDHLLPGHVCTAHKVCDVESNASRRCLWISGAVVCSCVCAYLCVYIWCIMRTYV